MSGKVYDRLKWVSLVLLPGLASLYFALGEVWHVPYVQQVIATITILDTFLGFLIGKSSKNFQENVAEAKYMGEVAVIQDFDGTPVSLQVNTNDKKPVFVEDQIVQFKVVRQSYEKPRE